MLVIAACSRSTGQPQHEQSAHPKVCYEQLQGWFHEPQELACFRIVAGELSPVPKQTVGNCLMQCIHGQGQVTGPDGGACELSDLDAVTREGMQALARGLPDDAPG